VHILVKIASVHVKSNKNCITSCNIEDRDDSHSARSKNAHFSR